IRLCQQEMYAEGSYKLHSMKIKQIHSINKGLFFSLYFLCTGVLYEKHYCNRVYSDIICGDEITNSIQCKVWEIHWTQFQSIPNTTIGNDRHYV
ncbi:MAG: hypothetical protein ACO30M_10765, partial [Candidatus Kapaibacteriota bacterium]